jgi:glycosyltransferase involved in cell wall biosynthesis
MKLSIITVNLNNAEGLRKTIESVVSQTFPNFEYIVIDGVSADGSVNIIKQYADKITYWISEPDKGIYNAMNKGILQAKGEYCLFLNSGDSLVDNTILERVFSENLHEDIIYGDIYGIQKHRKKVFIPAPHEWTFRKSMYYSIHHQAAFIKRQLFFEISLYDETFAIISDWIFFLIAIVIQNKSYIHIPYCISNYELEGISTDQEKYNMEREVFFSKNPYMAELVIKTFFELQKENEIYEQRINELLNLTEGKFGILVRFLLKIRKCIHSIKRMVKKL